MIARGSYTEISDPHEEVGDWLRLSAPSGRIPDVSGSQDRPDPLGLDSPSDPGGPLHQFPAPRPGKHVALIVDESADRCVRNVRLGDRGSAGSVSSSTQAGANMLHHVAPKHLKPQHGPCLMGFGSNMLGG